LWLRNLHYVNVGIYYFFEYILRILARALQHETDHLNGVLFIDRLPPELRKEAMKEIRQAEWFLAASEAGSAPEIRLSPHSTFGKSL